MQRPLLPIDATLPALLEALAAHRNVVLQAPTGAGKSTAVPLALLAAAWRDGRKLIMLEPRRLAARAVAHRMAQLLGEPVGHTVGYRTRLESKVSSSTRVEVLTEALLTRWLQRDPLLEDVAGVLFDEFHERNLHADLALALCLDAQRSVREDLRILVMSATLDTAAVAAVLDAAPVINAPGRAFPVTTHYRTVADTRGAARRGQEDVALITAGVVSRALQEETGDVLVFLPGQREIHRTQRLLEAGSLPAATRVLPLYGDLAFEQQEAALRRAAPGERKVVLATNIAETSLTIEGVRVVVDSGLARSARFDPAIGMSRLETVRISRSAADQRQGRAGRLEAGVCYRLWSQTEHAGLHAHDAPEILATDLAALVLELAEWGVTQPGSLRWLDPPAAAPFNQARDLLCSLEALDAQGHITAHGRKLARLGAHPRLAHMMVRGSELGHRRVALEIAALLGERDVMRGAAAQDVDLRLRVEALHQPTGLTGGSSIDAATRQRVQRTFEQLARQLDAGPHGSPSATARVGAQRPSSDATGLLLALAYPDRIAQLRGESGRYLLTSGRGARVATPQSLASAEFIVIADLEGGEREALIRLAAPLTRAELERHFAVSIETRERVGWDAREQAVVMRHERWLGAVLLEERRLENPDQEQVLQAMLSGVRELGIEQLPWTPAAQALRSRIRFAAQFDHSKQARWPALDNAHLQADLEGWLAPHLAGVVRREQLARLDLHAVVLGLLDWQQQQRLEQLAPSHLVVPSGSRIPIDYSGAAPSIAVRLQEVFGMRATPMIGGGQVPLTLQLLSPAHRPVQVTRDLGSFWARGYAEVKKELKGRYPKHYWPDDPLSAQPTARTKKRM
jgi:ATP-dependent helicase HrpB